MFLQARVVAFVCLILGTLGTSKDDTVYERIPCDPVWNTVFQCNIQDLSYATAFGMNLSCAKNQVCNFGYYEPCQPCLDNVHWCSDIYTCLDETTVKIGLNIFTCPDTYKCNTNYEEACKPCIQVATISTPTTPKTTTTEKISIPPNCNDGKAISKPCRRGPTSSNYYYQCVRYSRIWYDYDAKPCALRKFNRVCNNADVC